MLASTASTEEAHVVWRVGGERGCDFFSARSTTQSELFEVRLLSHLLSPLLFVFLDRVAFRHIPSTLMVGFVSRFASQMNGGDQ